MLGIVVERCFQTLSVSNFSSSKIAESEMLDNELNRIKSITLSGARVNFQCKFSERAREAEENSREEKFSDC